MLYRVVRMYQNPNKPTRAVRGMGGLYLSEVQAHCSDPETSSKTCTLPVNVRRTRLYGPWFDGYEEDK